MLCTAWNRYALHAVTALIRFTHHAIFLPLCYSHSLRFALVSITIRKITVNNNITDGYRTLDLAPSS